MRAQFDCFVPLRIGVPICDHTVRLLCEVSIDEEEEWKVQIGEGSLQTSCAWQTMCIPSQQTHLFPSFVADEATSGPNLEPSSIDSHLMDPDVFAKAGTEDPHIVQIEANMKALERNRVA